MQLHLKTMFFVIWLGNIATCHGNNVSSSESDSDGVLSEVPGLGSVLSDTSTSVGSVSNETVEDNEINNDTKICSEEPIDDSIYILRCPDVLAFDKHFLQDDNNYFEIVIESVGGIFNFPQQLGRIQLGSLKISEANLTSFNSSSETQFLKSLKKMDLSGNPDFDAQSLVNLGKLESLTYLSMRGSALKTLDSKLPDLLQNVPKLEHLDLSYCEIGSDDGVTIFTSNTVLRSLKTLDLSGNPDFNAQDLRNLEKLESLTSLFMKGSANKTLDEQLPYLLKNLPNLEYLNVHSTGITYLDDPDIFDSNKKLKHLDISGNDKLSVITFHADFIHQMIYLNLSNCILRRIKVEEDLMWNLHHYNQKDVGIMEVLDVSNNRLKEIPPSLLSALRNYSFLLNISRNAFGEASENCQTFHLWHFLQLLPTEVHVPGKESGRGLVVGEEELRFREKIALSKCQWNSCPPGCHCNSKEKIVDCSNIGLKTLPQVAPSSAEILLLQNNNLTTLEGIQSAAWCNLKILDVGYNNVSRIFYDRKIQGNCKCETKEAYSNEQAHCLPQNLEEIHLNNNTLQNFTKNDCLLLSPLHELDLSGNKMKTLASICDGPLNYLETLTVTGNTIGNINVNDIYQYPRLKTLHISECTTLSENVRLSRENLSVIECDRKEISLVNEGPSPSTTGNTSSEVPDELIMTVVILVIILIIVLYTCYTNYRRNSSTGIKRKFEPPKTVAKRKKYDCFVVCSSEDFTRVREMIIVPLTQRGYSIAWHDNAFVPGDWIMHNVERAVQNSSRMMIFGTQNLVSSRWGLHEIRRGCHEEFVNPDFKVLALVDETLPKKLNRDLYNIVCLRTHIKLTDRDYIEQICRFLPPQELPENSDLQPDSLQESLNDINELLERYEEIRRKERLTSARRLGELFHTYREQGKVSIRVDVGTAFSSHVCDDKATCPSCQKEQSALIQRFKGGPHSSSALDLSKTSTRQEYTIDGESCEDITDILNEDGFIRGWKRTT